MKPDKITQKYNFLLLLLAVFIAHCLPAAAESFNFSRLDNSNGLSNNQVECIFKDSRGFIWFGTNFGLNRYDGTNFVVYKNIKGDSTSLANNTVRGIQEDANGNLWVKGNPYYSVYNFRTDRFISIREALGQAELPQNPEIVEISEKKDFYIYDSFNGVIKYDVRSGNITHFAQGNGNNALSKGIVCDLKNYGSHCWVLFENGMLERLNENTGEVDFRSDFIHRGIAGSTIIKNLFIDSEGDPWIFPGFSDKGVLSLNMKEQKWTTIDQSHKNVISDFVRAVAEDQEGQIWIASDHGGINIYNKKTKDIILLKHESQNPNSIGQNTTICLYCDDQGTVWVGTYKNGVSFYNPKMFKFEPSPLFFYHNPKMEIKDCNALYEDSKGNLWIGTNGEGLLRYNKKDGSFRLFQHDPNNPKSISSNIIISILEDHKGKMWFGTFLGGLNCLEGDSFLNYQPDQNNNNSLSNKSIYSLIEDRQHNIWIATLGNGVDRLDSTRKQFTHFNTTNSRQLSDDYILSMYSPDRITIYLCTSYGISVLNTETSNIVPYFKTKEQIDALSEIVAYNTLVDHLGQLWIATDNGINIFNPEKGKITYLMPAEGLPSEQIVSLEEDRSGKIWAGTRNGLACISMQEDDQEIRYTIVSFDEKDGLPGATCNHNAVFKNREGRIYVGGTRGYTCFDPSDIPFNTQIPQARFTQLRIGNQVIHPLEKYSGRVILDEDIVTKSKLRLNYNENSLSIGFSALSYIHPEKNKYKYRLKGFDSDWTETGEQTAAWSNLNPGTYRLEVYTCNNDGLWCASPLTLDITINPPFWLTWWAYCLYVLLVFALLYLTMRYLLKKQRAELENAQRIRESQQIHQIDEMKFRFFTNISHEFRTPLTLILNPTEKLLTEERRPEERTLLNIIHKNAKGLLDLVNQLLDFRKLDVNKVTLNISTGDVVAFTKEICYAFAELANDKGIHLSFSSAVSGLRMEFDNDKLEKIINNLLSNAFKYTPKGGRIHVALSVIQDINNNGKTLKIDVEDTGIGISKEHLPRIFERFYRIENEETVNISGTGVGLHLASEYAKLHQGEIKASSEVGKGSVFSVRIPITENVYHEIINQKISDSGEEDKSETKEIETAPETREDKSALPLMLIVDDNDDFRSFISGLFNHEYQILTAANGQEAWASVLDKIPDIIISDVMMPVMDGYKFCRKIKDDIRTSHIPIILLTAKASEESKYAGIEAGANDYISKPFNMDMLKLKVSQLVEQQRKIQEKFSKRIDITPSEVEIVSMDEKFVRKAVELVEKNMSNTDFGVEELGKEMGMSRVYFYKKILSLTAKPPSEFIRFIRLKRAADLLGKSQLFVNEVAFQTGFNDLKSFRKYFKEEFGVTPNDYKKKFE